MSASSRHLHWGAQALWQELNAVLEGLTVEVVASVDSTNTRLIENARRSSGRHNAPVTTPGQLDAASIAGEPPSPYGRRHADTSPSLLVAEQQSSGRGRQGRAWLSSPGCSLTFSLALPLDPVEWAGLSLAVGVTLADALDPPPAPPRVGLKWPNDLWLIDGPGRGRKLGGILIETVAVGDRRMAVIGIGLNVLPLESPDASPQAFATGFACLQELDPDITAPAALHRVARPLAVALKRFEAEGLAPFVEAWRRRDMLLGQTVLTTFAGVPEGVAEGIDEHGALRVRSGELHRVVSGEVSVRLAAGS